MSLRTLTVLPIGLLAVPLCAQIAFGGRPYGEHAVELGLPAPAVHHFPALDVPAFLAADSLKNLQHAKGPYHFGFTHACALGLHNSGTWGTLANGDHVWRIVLACPEALGINLAFSEYVVPQGARVFIYNADGDVLGAYTAESNGGAPEMGVSPIAGERVAVEYIEPPAVYGQGRLTIGAVTHEYRDVFGGQRKNFGESGSCNVNTICPAGDDFRDQIRSVARIIYGGDWCTGQLINNCAQDGTPYFLTANHCVSNVSSFNNWVFQFNWESPTCATTTNAPVNHTLSGATLLFNSTASDVALLRLNTTPPSSYRPFYTGWDKSGAVPQGQTCIHHPAGDIKKISHDNDPPGSSVENFGTGNAQCWHIFNWDSGTTEGGSSGSGLWDQNGRLIGQLYGGAASCQSNVDDYFGKFSVSYPLLQSWLGTCGTTLDGYRLRPRASRTVPRPPMRRWPPRTPRMIG
ncbi:MAG: serine protease [Flavobacteriales bacterium]